MHHISAKDQLEGKNEQCSIHVPRHQIQISLCNGPGLEPIWSPFGMSAEHQHVSSIRYATHVIKLCTPCTAMLDLPTTPLTCCPLRKVIRSARVSPAVCTCPFSSYLWYQYHVNVWWACPGIGGWVRLWCQFFAIPCWLPCTVLHMTMSSLRPLVKIR
jgi:hypothetical protein